MMTEQKFEQLYRDHYADFLRYAKAIFTRRCPRSATAGDLAEDAVQEMFAFAWERRDQIPRDPMGWFYRCLYYKICELLRQDRIWRRRLLKISQYYEAPAPENFPLRVELESVLPEAEYLLLKRLYLDGASYQELCADCGLGKSALAMRVKRAKERFAESYGEN